MQYSIVVAAQYGNFSTPVVTSATGLPGGAIATFAPPSVSPGSAQATSVLTIQVPVNSATVLHGASRIFMAVFLLPLFGSLFRRRSRRPAMLPLLASMLLLAVGASITGCGGGFSLPSATYNVTITGTSAGQQQSTTVQLTVQ